MASFPVLHSITSIFITGSRPANLRTSALPNYEVLALGTKSSLTNWAKLVGVGAASELWVLAGRESGLLMHVAATESVSLCVRMKS